MSPLKQQTALPKGLVMCSVYTKLPFIPLNFQRRLRVGLDVSCCVLCLLRVMLRLLVLLLMQQLWLIGRRFHLYLHRFTSFVYTILVDGLPAASNLTYLMGRSRLLVLILHHHLLLLLLHGKMKMVARCGLRR